MRPKGPNHPNASVRGPAPGQAEREREAPKLRAQGLTYAQIAERLGCSYGAAWRAANLSETDRDRAAKRRRHRSDGTVRCSRCREHKPPAAFSETKALADLPSWCLACHEADRRARGVAPRPGTLVHPPGMKTCRACLTAKPLTAFSPHLKSPLGVSSRCRPCQNAVVTSSFRRCRNGMFEWERRKDERLRRVYGISLAAYRQILARQRGRCVICLQRFGIGPRRQIHVDHSHRTGQVRGLLCHLCNVALGSIREDLGSLLRAVSYLKDREWFPEAHPGGAELAARRDAGHRVVGDWRPKAMQP